MRCEGMERREVMCECFCLFLVWPGVWFIWKRPQHEKEKEKKHNKKHIKRAQRTVDGGGGLEE